MSSPRALLLAALLAMSCGGAPPPDQRAACPASQDRGSAEPAAMARIPVGQAERGAGLFERECAKCHAPRVIERASRLFWDYPRLDCPAYLARVSDAYLARVISAGGPAVGLDSAMKSFGEVLSPSEISDVVAYLRSAPQR